MKVGVNSSVILALTMVMWVGCVGIQEVKAEDAPFDLNDPVHINAGKELFSQTCVYCHGYEGVGGKGTPLKGRTDLTPNYLFNTITNGRRNGPRIMPAWRSTFDSDSIWNLAAYVWSLRGHDAAGK